MAISSIEWTEMTWNPTTGCDKISAGCKNCYAEVMSQRLQAMGLSKYSNGFELTLHPFELQAPFKWEKSKKVFVNSMSDLFHPDVPDQFIQKVFDVMNNTPRHTYQILSKRSERLLEISHNLNWTENIWIGVSVEDERVTHRIKDLSKIKARVKFLSCEPLIGRIKSLNLKNIDWVIVGGESGFNARPLNIEWVMEIKQACIKFQIPFFFKQWGKKKFNTNPDDPTILKNHPQHAKGGCQLKGRVYREMPVQEF
jgi:protein gp37